MRTRPRNAVLGCFLVGATSLLACSTSPAIDAVGTAASAEVAVEPNDVPIPDVLEDLAPPDDPEAKTADAPAVPAMPYEVTLTCRREIKHEFTFLGEDDGDGGVCSVTLRSTSKPQNYEATGTSVDQCVLAKCEAAYPTVEQTVALVTVGSKKECEYWAVRGKPGMPEVLQETYNQLADAGDKEVADLRKRSGNDLLRTTCELPGESDKLKGCEGIPTRPFSMPACVGRSLGTAGSTLVGENRSFKEVSGLGGLVSKTYLAGATFMCTWVETCTPTVGGAGVLSTVDVTRDSLVTTQCFQAPQSGSFCVGSADFQKAATTTTKGLFRRAWTAPFPAPDAVADALVELAYGEEKARFEKDCGAAGAKLTAQNRDALCQQKVDAVLASQKKTDVGYCCTTKTRIEE